MTKEGLEKEAEEKAGIYFDSLDYDHGNVSDTPFSGYDVFVAYKKGALDFAEPREKQIEELKEKLKTAYRKGMRHMAKALKDYDRTDGVWTDYFEHTVDKVLQREQLDFEEYGTLADQLTKAKVFIRSLKSLIEDVCDINYLSKDNTRLLVEAEQFLNSEVEK